MTSQTVENTIIKNGQQGSTVGVENSAVSNPISILCPSHDDGSVDVRASGEVHSDGNPTAKRSSSNFYDCSVMDVKDLAAELLRTGSDNLEVW